MRPAYIKYVKGRHWTLYCGTSYRFSEKWNSFCKNCSDCFIWKEQARQEPEIKNSVIFKFWLGQDLFLKELDE